VRNRHPEGLLELHAAIDVSGRTYLNQRIQRFPLRITTPMYLDPGDPGMAFCYVQNPTGGVFAGDRLVERLVAGPGARLHVTSQSATKLYRMDGAEAFQEIHCRVGAGALLERIPDALIPQAGSRFTQHTEVEIENGGMFIAAETVAPGRVAHGECFRYDHLRLRTEVRRGSRLLCVDSLVLEPGRVAPRRHGLLGANDYVASLLVVAPGEDGEALAACIDSALARVSEVRAAAGCLPGGVGAVARILGDSAPPTTRALRTAWQAARRRLLGLAVPRERK
jgi:urease accessory protein